MSDQPRSDPTNPSPQTPRPPQQGTDAGPKLGREEAGRGIDTGVDTGAIQPGASGDADPLN